jgi:hypothetical protein
MFSKITSYLVSFFVLGALLFFGAKADQKAYFGMLFGAAFTAFIAICVEHELRPQIRITKETTPPIVNGRKFLRVRVENRALWWPLKRIMDRRPAQQVRAWITFLTENDNLVFSEGRRMIGRWADTPEPVRPISANLPGGNRTVTLLWDLSLTRDAIDITAGSSELLDIVMRGPNENGCRGWHNRIIQRADPPPEEQFNLEKGRYNALVKVEVSGRSVEARFRIVCDVGIGDFRLEPL